MRKNSSVGVLSERINSLTRIATDLERAIIGIFATAGLLGAILFVLILRWVIEGH
jgi:hypothetical protein